MADPTQRGALTRDDNSIPAGWKFSNITTATTTVVKGSAGILHSIVINTPVTSGAISVYDNASAGSGTTIATITYPATLITGTAFLEYDIAFNNGLTIVTTGTQDVTISYI